MGASFEDGFALLVGVDENQVKEWALPTVANDVEELRKVLVHPERCAYPAEHVKVVSGAAATRDGVLTGLEWLGERIRGAGNATAVVYYSGHGFRDPAHPEAFYFVPYDAKAQALVSRSLRAEDFAAAVAALDPERLFVVLDCCHAGGMNVKAVAAAPALASAAAPVSLLVPGGKGATPAQGTQGLAVLAQGSGRAVLSSSRDDQPSSVRKDGKLSLFTYHLIEALTGHAQPQEGAREVLVSDVMSHVYRRVPESARADWNRDQEPQYQVTGNFPIALLLGGGGWTKGISAPDPLAKLPGGRGRSGDVVRGDKITANVKVGRVSGGQVIGVVHGDNTFSSVPDRPARRRRRKRQPK